MADALFDIDKKYPILKEEHKRNVEEYLEKKVLESNTDIESNKKEVTKLYKLEEEFSKLNKKMNLFNLLRVFLIVIVIILLLAAIFLIVSFVRGVDSSLHLTYGLVLGFSIVLSIIFIVILALPIRKKINLLTLKTNELEKVIEEKRQLCFDMLRPLASIIENNIQVKLFQKTLPLINLDQNFDMAKYSLLKDKYKLFSYDQDMEKSTLAVQSGHINGNPFVLLNILQHVMGTQTYYGELQVSYQTSTFNSKGERSFQTVYQTLYASVTKPCPFYSTDYILCYGNEAAEDLVFERKPSGIDQAAKIDKFIKSKVKEFRNDVNRIQKNNPKFTALANEEFEAIFGALDRNNETQFRLLLTSSAQLELMKIFKNNEYGFQDKFIFNKERMMNYITPTFIPKDFKLDFDVLDYFTFDYEKMKEEFIQLNLNYFTILYYIMAPILSIPLYQEHKPEEYIYRKTLAQRYPNVQYEEVANKYQDVLNPLSKTLNIIKAKFISEQEDGSELLKLTSMGYDIEKRIDYVLVRDNSGRAHNVPVEWDYYRQVFSSDDIIVKTEQINNYQEYISKYNDSKNVRYTHNLVSSLKTNQEIKERIISRDNSEIDSNDIN